MNNIKIHIKGQFQDGYLYGGQLFLLGNNGSIDSINLWDLVSQNLVYKSDEYHFFKLIFTQNNWLTNIQANSFLGISTLKKQFDSLWKVLSKIEYNFELPKDKSFQISKNESSPAFDFQIYGMRLYVGNRDGLYEAPFNISGNNEVKLTRKIERVFDARTTQISAKAGAVMLSSNSDGLFHGQLLNYESKLSVKQKAIAPKSIRNSWSGYDLLNYEAQNKFDYLKGKYSVSEERKYLYSQDDETSRKISIDSIGEKSFPITSLISNLKFEESDIIYTFNSNQFCFFFLKNGQFFHTYFKKDTQNEEVRLSSRVYNLPQIDRKSNFVTKPISTKLIQGGCIIEYYDKVILVRNNQKIILENKPVTAIKTFPNSLRYKNVIACFDGEGLSIHSLYPF